MVNEICEICVLTTGPGGGVVGVVAVGVVAVGVVAVGVVAVVVVGVVAGSTVYVMLAVAVLPSLLVPFTV
ncbi:MAG: hypothetical protein ACRDQH_10720 [Pseudonocardiaceae bacterium]